MADGTKRNKTIELIGLMGQHLEGGIVKRGVLTAETQGTQRSGEKLKLGKLKAEILNTRNGHRIFELRFAILGRVKVLIYAPGLWAA